MSKFQINVHELIYALSGALDLVGVDHLCHGKRVAFMAVECGKRFGWKAEQLDTLFLAAILHDCGVSKTSVHAKLAQFEWEKEHDHCQIGAALLEKIPSLAHLSEIILQHHTHWGKLQHLDLPRDVKMYANCIYMVDRVDVLTLKYQRKESNILLGAEKIRQKISDKSRDWFCFELVDTFLEISNSEAFWFSLENENIDGYVHEWCSREASREIEFNDLKGVVRLFSHIVDAKSAYTEEHSQGVARLSRLIAELFNLDEHSCDKLELAGELHDLGKLRVPDEILDKPGKLTAIEYQTIQRHSFDTFTILNKVDGFEDIALWSAQHHERVDGEGYPYHLNRQSLSIEARILAVADVFQALAQDRPYRSSMSPDEILTILKKEVEQKKLDSGVVAMVEENLQQCWNAALLIEVVDAPDNVLRLVATI